MAIQDEMFKMIEKEINEIFNSEKKPSNLDLEKVKEVAKMLTPGNRSRGPSLRSGRRAGGTRP